MDKLLRADDMTEDKEACFDHMNHVNSGRVNEKAQIENLKQIVASLSHELQAQDALKQ